MPNKQSDDSPSREKYLREKYGEILTLEEIAKLLRYPTVGAARKAFNRGRFPIALKRFPNRPGYYATARSVANFLDSFENTDNLRGGET